jgi:hypothetical protein
MAPPWEPAKEPTEAIEKAAMMRVDSSLFILNILRMNLISKNAAHSPHENVAQL